MVPVAELDRPHAAPTVAAALTRWLAPPDVLADPHQLVDGRVWTRAEDVLPGVSLPPGRPVTACWGELSWQATPEWDPVDPDVLWLVPLTEPVTVPAPTDCYPLSDVVRIAWAEALGPSAPTLPVPAQHAFERALTRSLAPLLADFEASLTLLMEAVRQDRDTARAVLTALSETAPHHRTRRLLHRPVGLRLLRLARRARPPRARAHGS